MWFAVLLCILTGVILWKRLRRSTRFPPGPTTFPIVGNFFALHRLIKETGYFHLAVCRLGEKYGPMVGMRLGSNPPTVFILGYEAVLEAFSKSELDGRPHSYLTKLRTMGQRRGVIATDGQFWKIQRRFLMHNLRDFGFGKQSMEVIIQEEAVRLVKYLEMVTLNHSKGVALDEALTLPVLNSLWSIVAGERYEMNDSTLKRYMNIQEIIFKNLNSSRQVIDIFPWLRHICPDKSGFNDLKTHHTAMWNFFLDIVNQHKDTLQNHTSRDLIDVYLHEKQSINSTDTFSEEQIISVLKDLFAAGAETTSNTLSFFYLYMLLYPQIQLKVQEEIDRVVGHEKLPSINNRQNMPYLSAVLLEVQRISNIATHSLPHRALSDVEMRGYIIPKDSTVQMSLYSVHMDKEYWGDPEVFRPERHLNKEGAFIPNARVIPFGTGHRRCLGEILARNSLFLFAAIVLQSITLSSPSDSQSPSTTPRKGLTLSPQSYKVLVIKRR